jgi:hypothetical protein
MWAETKLQQLFSEGRQMSTTLIATSDFGAYKRGDVITDAASVMTILGGPQRTHVVRVAATAATAAATAKALPAKPAPTTVTTTATVNSAATPSVATLESELVAALAAQTKA